MTVYTPIRCLMRKLHIPTQYVYFCYLTHETPTQTVKM